MEDTKTEVLDYRFCILRRYPRNLEIPIYSVSIYMIHISYMCVCVNTTLFLALQKSLLE